jgi:hypothetical protein
MPPVSVSQISLQCSALMIVLVPRSRKRLVSE